jgi:Fur family iron response transcriptional regulator
LLREIVVDAGRSYFDTNTSTHHHFFDESSGMLTDVPHGQLQVSGIPTPPNGSEIESVNVVVRIRAAS